MEAQSAAAGGEAAAVLAAHMLLSDLVFVQIASVDCLILELSHAELSRSWFLSTKYLELRRIPFSDSDVGYCGKMLTLKLQMSPFVLIWQA